jgi:hypothetical protein
MLRSFSLGKAAHPLMSDVALQAMQLGVEEATLVVEDQGAIWWVRVFAPGTMQVVEVSPEVAAQ